MTREENIQYEQCLEDWRHYDRAMWELPSVSLAVTTGVVAVAYQVITLGIARLLVLLFGFMMQTSFAVALWKHRTFQGKRIDVLSEIEDKWIRNGRTDFTVVRTSGGLKDTKLAKRVSATILLLATMFIMALSMLALLLMNVCELVGLP